jgi:hypothetical protein
MPGAETRSRRPRKEIRHLVEFPVEIRGPKRSFEGSGRDLGALGLRVRYAVHHLAPNDRVGLTLHLPVGRIELVADVRWAQRTTDQWEENAGIEFVHSPETRKRLHEIIAALEGGQLRGIQRRTRTVRAVKHPE